MTMRTALVESRNVRRPDQQAGISGHGALKGLRDLTSRPLANGIGLAIALVLQIAALRRLANGELYYKPYYITSVPLRMATPSTTTRAGKTAMNKATAYMIRCSKVINFRWFRNGRQPPLTAGKTGTTSAYSAAIPEQLTNRGHGLDGWAPRTTQLRLTGSLTTPRPRFPRTPRRLSTSTDVMYTRTPKTTPAIGRCYTVGCLLTGSAVGTGYSAA